MSDIPSYTPPPPPPPPPGGSYTPPPPPPPGGPLPSSDRTIMLVLSYLGILALIPLLMKKDDTEVQWHAKNGLGAAVALDRALDRHLHRRCASCRMRSLGCGLGVVDCVIWLGFLVVVDHGHHEGAQGRADAHPGHQRLRREAALKEINDGYAWRFLHTSTSTAATDGRNACRTGR